MDTVKLSVRKRDEKGKGPARRLRALGQVPAIVYGQGQEATPLAIQMSDLRDALSAGQNVVLELSYGGRSRKKQFAVLKEMQMHPVKRHLLHVDLHQIDLETEIEASVSIELTGHAIGVEEGGVLDQPLWEVQVRALPTSVPSSVEVDVTDLDFGDSLRVEDLVVPEGVELLDDPQSVVASVIAPEQEIEEEEEVSEEELEGLEVPEIGEEEEGEEPEGEEGTGAEEEE